jgi:hypothetical protein
MVFMLSYVQRKVGCMSEILDRTLAPHPLEEGFDLDTLAVLLEECDCVVAALVTRSMEGASDGMRDRAQGIIERADVSLTRGVDEAACARLICPERMCRFGCTAISSSNSLGDVDSGSVLTRPSDGRMSGHPCQTTGKM